MNKRLNKIQLLAAGICIAVSVIGVAFVAIQFPAQRNSQDVQVLTMTFNLLDGASAQQTFTSTEQGANAIQTDISSDLVAFLANGEHNITVVETTFTHGCMSSARVNYSVAHLIGAGNLLRLAPMLTPAEGSQCRSISAIAVAYQRMVVGHTSNIYRTYEVKNGSALAASLTLYLA